MITEQGFELKSMVIKRLEQAKACFSNDLKALGNGLGQTWGGVSRSAYDFTYEIIFVNRRIAKRIRGEEQEPFQFGEFMRAPEPFCSETNAVNEFETSTQEVIDALSAISADEITKTIQLPESTSTPLELGLFCATHIVYHDGQLNLMQAARGDNEVHWDF